MASAERYADRIDALGVALRNAGVAPEQVAALLGSAAEATMNALLLDTVLEANRHIDPPMPVVEEPPAEPLPLRVAA